MRQALVLLIAIIALVAIAVGYGRRMLAPAREPDVIVGTDGWLYPGWDRLADDHRGDVGHGVGMVAEVNRRLKARGIALVVLLIPNKARITPEHFPADRRAAVLRSHAYQDLAARLRDEGVTVADAAPVLRRLHDTGAPTYFPRDAHWTGVSAEAVADMLTPIVQGLGPLPGQAGDGEKATPWRIVRRYADLVAIQRRQGVLTYGEDDFQLRDYVPPPAPPYAVLIVGSSFADRQYGVPERLSQRLDRRVGIHIRFGADGCWQAMAEELRAPSQPAPKVIVWHLSEGSFSDRRNQAAMTAYLKAS